MYSLFKDLKSTVKDTHNYVELVIRFLQAISNLPIYVRPLLTFS